MEAPLLHLFFAETANMLPMRVERYIPYATNCRPTDSGGGEVPGYLAETTVPLSYPIVAPQALEMGRFATTPTTL